LQKRKKKKIYKFFRSIFKRNKNKNKNEKEKETDLVAIQIVIDEVRRRRR
jgi:hypothetical protein